MLKTAAATAHELLKTQWLHYKKNFLDMFPVREIEITFKIIKKGSISVKIKDFNINSEDSVIY